jgi:hypothetical protein
MKTRAVVTFPYSGFRSGDPRESVFWELLDCVKNNTNVTPVVVLNRDTEQKGLARAFLGNSRRTTVETVRAWSVDTCQMWLSGWGHVLDENDPAKKLEDDDRVVLVPADLDTVGGAQGGQSAFFGKLDSFLVQTNWDLIIGDFTAGDPFNAKELIDWYGTYPLMANWFPDVAQAIRKKNVHKPRSEFVNVRRAVLSELLTYRKFAYEQTLNMLIRSWDLANERWKYTVRSWDLGELKDDSSLRQYAGCLDQIDRTERMLRLLWREMRSGLLTSAPESFIDDYDALDRRSTSIRDSARIIIRNFLGTGRVGLPRAVATGRGATFPVVGSTLAASDPNLPR